MDEECVLCIYGCIFLYKKSLKGLLYVLTIGKNIEIKDKYLPSS